MSEKITGAGDGVQRDMCAHVAHIHLSFDFRQKLERKKRAIYNTALVQRQRALHGRVITVSPIAPPKFLCRADINH